MTSDNASVTIAERFVTGFVSFIAALCTVVVLAVVAILQFGSDSLRPAELKFFGWIAAGLLIIVPVVGFVVGPVRAARGWGVLWGTEEPRPWEIVAVLAVIIVVCFSVIFSYFRG